jgi:hypothetical protein
VSAPRPEPRERITREQAIHNAAQVLVQILATPAKPKK